MRLFSQPFAVRLGCPNKKNLRDFVRNQINSGNISTVYKVIFLALRLENDMLFAVMTILLLCWTFGLVSHISLGMLHATLVAILGLLVVSMLAQGRVRV